MALPADTARLPLMAYNFRVVIGAKTVGFKDVTGLSRSHETLTYRHGMSAFEGERITKYHYDKHTPITMKKATTVMDTLFLATWLESKFEIPMTVSLCNARGLPVVNWRMARVIPVKLTPPTYDVDSSSVSIDTLEVMAAGITVDIVPVVLAV